MHAGPCCSFNFLADVIQTGLNCTVIRETLLFWFLRTGGLAPLFVWFYFCKIVSKILIRCRLLFPFLTPKWKTITSFVSWPHQWVRDLLINSPRSLTHSQHYMFSDFIKRHFSPLIAVSLLCFFLNRAVSALVAEVKSQRTLQNG